MENFNEEIVSAEDLEQMVGEEFPVGTWVFAKRNSYLPWPGKIIEPPAAKIEGYHHVFFFGIKKCAWIPDDDIVPIFSDKKTLPILNSLSKAVYEMKKDIKISRAKRQPPKEVIETAVSENLIPSPLKKKKRTSVEVIDPKSNALFKKDNSSCSGQPRQTIKQKYDKAADADTIAVHRELIEFHRNCSNSLPYIERPDTPPLDIMAVTPTLQVKKAVPPSKRIGFLGLTALGCGILKNLLISGHSITVYNMEREKCEPFEKAGVKTVFTPMDVVKDCDIIFSCVSDTEVANFNMFGKYGILSGLNCAKSAEKSYVELSSIDAKTSVTFAENIKSRGAKYLEAPISGSRSEAEDGQLVVIATGDRPLFYACAVYFQHISKHAFFIGFEIGLAIKLNIIFSTLSGSMIAALAEALTLAKRCNISSATFMEIIAEKDIFSLMIQEKGKAMINETYTAESVILYQHRDIVAALSMANSLNQPLLIALGAHELYTRAKQQYYGEHDASAVIKVIEMSTDS